MRQLPSSLQQALRQLETRLDLPHPARARVLLEVAADLEELVRIFRDSGMPDELAVERALEHCDLSDEAIAGLVAVHAGPYRRFLERIGSRNRARWERIALAVVLMAALVLGGRVALSGRIVVDAGPVVWPILLLSAIAFLLAAPRAYAIWLRQAHEPRRLGAGLGALPVLAAGNLLLGALGVLWGLREIASQTPEAADPSLWFLATWLHGGSALLVVALLTAILIAAAWFALAIQVSRIEEAAATALLGEIRSPEPHLEPS